MVRDIQDEPYSRVIATVPARSIAIAPVVRSTVLWGGPALLIIGVLGWPLIFTGSFFNGDWISQLWFMSQQGLAIRADHLPSLFLNYSGGVLYPHYAFYGGTLYALAGTLSLVLGNAPIEAYILTYLLGFAASYGGWYWMGRMSGLDHWWAQVPGLVFITSAYYITLIYARGDWPEFIGVSMIPLMIAAGLSVLRADRLRLGGALALTASSIVFFGSHSLTLVWGATLILLVGLAIVLCVPRARRELTRAGVIRVAGLVIPALLVNAWFLLPALAYEANTEIASGYQSWRALLQSSMFLVSTGNIFTLARTSATTSTPPADFALTLPILALGWVFAGLLVFLPRGLRGAWIRVLLICAALTALMIVLMTKAEFILALPRVYSTLQFSYRLESYILLGLSGSILAILTLSRSGGRKTRLWSWTIVPILVVSVGGAIKQVNVYPQTENRQTKLEKLYQPGHPESGEVLTDYLDVRLPLLEDPYGQPPQVNFTPTAVQDNRVSSVVRLSPGQLAYTNLQGPPSLVHVAGARIVGIDRGGYDVLEVGSGGHAAWRSPAPASTETISLSPADSFPVVLGRVLALAGAIALVLQFVALAIRRRRESGSGLDSPGGPGHGSRHPG